jgi:hypothetical protein
MGSKEFSSTPSKYSNPSSTSGFKSSPSSDSLKAAGQEMKENPPAILARTRSKFGAARAEKQRRAILMSKAGSSGVKTPKLSM